MRCTRLGKRRQALTDLRWGQPKMRLAMALAMSRAILNLRKTRAGEEECAFSVLDIFLRLELVVVVRYWLELRLCK